MSKCAERVTTLEARIVELETAADRLRFFEADYGRLKAVEAEYDRLKQRASRLEDELERLTRLTRGEGDWECSNCDKPLHTVTEWEQHECLTTEKLFNGLARSYEMTDPELIVETLSVQPEREELFELLMKLRPLIEKNFHAPEVSLELSRYAPPGADYTQLINMVTFDVFINPEEHPGEAFKCLNRLTAAARELPGFKEQPKLDISVKYSGAGVKR
jgi:hypothetical protein